MNPRTPNFNVATIHHFSVQTLALKTPTRPKRPRAEQHANIEIGGAGVWHTFCGWAFFIQTPVALRSLDNDVDTKAPNLKRQATLSWGHGGFLMTPFTNNVFTCEIISVNSTPTNSNFSILCRICNTSDAFFCFDCHARAPFTTPGDLKPLLPANTVPSGHFAPITTHPKVHNRQEN